MSFIFELLKGLLFFVGYVSTKRSFPEPLTKSDEECYLRMYAETKDDSAREKLIMHNMRLVAHIAKKYAKHNGDIDDLISIGTIGLVKAITTFQADKGNLATYSSRCIDNEILMFLRREKKRITGEVSLDETIGRDNEGNEVTIGDRLCGSCDEVTSDVGKSLFRERFMCAAENVLSERENTVIAMRYNLCGKRSLTQREVAESLGVSRSYVSRIEKKALAKLAKSFSGSYEDWCFDE